MSWIFSGHKLVFVNFFYNLLNLFKQVNVTAISSDEQFRPAAKLIVTTSMAAPKPMVKPDTIESKNKQLITVILPQASEELGLISHYYLVVVPKQDADKEPDQYTIEELSSTPMDKVGPYIAAKWMRRSIPNTFSLGDGQKYNGFINRKLQKEVEYRIFVRAVVDTPQKVMHFIVSNDFIISYT